MEERCAVVDGIRLGMHVAAFRICEQQARPRAAGGVIAAQGEIQITAAAAEAEDAQNGSVLVQHACAQSAACIATWEIDTSTKPNMQLLEGRLATCASNAELTRTGSRIDDKNVRKGWRGERWRGRSRWRRWQRRG